MTEGASRDTGKVDNGQWGRLHAGTQRRTALSAEGNMVADVEGRQLWLQFSQLNSKQTELSDASRAGAWIRARGKLGRKSRLGRALASACSLSGFV